MPLQNIAKPPDDAKVKFRRESDWSLTRTDSWLDDGSPQGLVTYNSHLMFRDLEGDCPKAYLEALASLSGLGVYPRGIFTETYAVSIYQFLLNLDANLRDEFLYFGFGNIPDSSIDNLPEPTRTDFKKNTGKFFLQFSGANVFPNHFLVTTVSYNDYDSKVFSYLGSEGTAIRFSEFYVDKGLGGQGLVLKGDDSFKKGSIRNRKAEDEKIKKERAKAKRKKSY